MTYLIDSSITHENICVTKTHTSVFQSTSASLLSNRSLIVAVQLDGQMDGQMDGWVDLMDRQTDEQVNNVQWQMMALSVKFQPTLLEDHSGVFILIGSCGPW